MLGANGAVEIPKTRGHHHCPQADRAGGKPCTGRSINQRVTTDIWKGTSSNTV